MKLKRGQKLCKNCNNINGARAHTCKHCNTEFVASSKNKKPAKPKKPKKFIEVNWSELQKGDRIKVVGRSGNYYINEAGDRMYMSDAGIYTVQDKDDKGLIVYGNDNGFGYIYMGPEKRSTYLDNYYNAPHKIVKVNYMPVRP